MPFFKPGTVVGVSTAPLITHVGIATGQGTVITNSKSSGCVCEQSVEEFAAGKLLKIVGYPGNLEAAKVIRRAKSLIGTRYNLLNFNCEHFVRWAHGLRPASAQIWVAVFVVIAAALVITRWKR